MLQQYSCGRSCWLAAGAAVDASSSSSSASPLPPLPSRSAESSDEDGVAPSLVGDPWRWGLSSSAFFLVRVLQKFLISLSVRPGRLLAIRDHLLPHLAWSSTMRRSSSAVMRPRRRPGWR
ncbi:unnamed protein product [Urochloa humidicola]